MHFFINWNFALLHLEKGKSRLQWSGNKQIKYEFYLEVYGFHLVFDSVGLSHQGQYWGDFLGVLQVLHHCVDGVHHPAGVLPELAALLHLLRILHVLKLAEILFGWREVDKEPKENRRRTVRSRRQSWTFSYKQSFGLGRGRVIFMLGACSYRQVGVIYPNPSPDRWVF